MVKILIADDDFISLEIMKAMLTRDGIEVVTAADGQSALTCAHTEQPDLILLDYEMPDMTGAEVAANLRAQGMQAPMIAVTSHRSATELNACQAAGMAGTLHKPVAPDALEELLSRWLT